jgi:HD-GYP domain-containing protein (c-di-GMP phosphodiesterase class II)
MHTWRAPINPTTMSFEPTWEEQDVLAATVQRRYARMARRERLGEFTTAFGFALATALLIAIQPPRAVAIAPAAVCTAVLVFATLIRFETPLGFTVPTQLAFVPLLFALPVTLVPVATVAALTAGELVVCARQRTHPSRVGLAVGNAWFAVGPTTVFVAAGVTPAHASAGLLLAALGAQFAVDFAAATARCAMTRGVALALQVRDTWVYVIDAGLAGIGLEIARDVPQRPLAALTLVPLLALLGVFARERSRRLHHVLELNDAYRGTALVLGDVVEADDGYTGQHCQEVVRLALVLGGRVALTSDQRRNLEFGALLHDVGKIVIPKAIINKPGKLDPQEWEVVKTHTTEGQRMLDRVGGFMREVGVIVRAHHERWDGTGYPDGLAGSAIPLEARIIACCDTWNAMRTDRAYRSALRHEDALAELRRVAGTQLDPVLVGHLIDIVQGDHVAPDSDRARYSARWVGDADVLDAPDAFDLHRDHVAG